MSLIFDSLLLLGHGNGVHLLRYFVTRVDISSDGNSIGARYDGYLHPLSGSVSPLLGTLPFDINTVLQTHGT